KLAQIWWQQIGDVNSGVFTPQEAMDRLAAEMDDAMARMQRADEASGVYGGCGPRLNEPKDPSEWLGPPDGPQAKVGNRKPQGETINYDELGSRGMENQWRHDEGCPPAGAGSRLPFHTIRTPGNEATHAGAGQRDLARGGGAPFGPVQARARPVSR